LIAELDAAFLCAEFGFDGDVRNAGYIASWIELLKANNRAFFTACSNASKAADYLRGLALAEPAEISGVRDAGDDQPHALDVALTWRSMST
jgi:antirestriction protein ArdC